nr:hypothetical protein [Qingshengfaniella alkalisoli]
MAAWLDEAEDSMLVSFTRGLRSNQASVAAVLRKGIAKLFEVERGFRGT